jgi:hypothetical protein
VCPAVGAEDECPREGETCVGPTWLMRAKPPPAIYAGRFRQLRKRDRPHARTAHPFGASEVGTDQGRERPVRAHTGPLIWRSVGIATASRMEATTSRTHSARDRVWIASHSELAITVSRITAPPRVQGPVAVSARPTRQAVVVKQARSSNPTGRPSLMWGRVTAMARSVRRGSGSHTRRETGVEPVGGGAPPEDARRVGSTKRGRAVVVGYSAANRA